MAPSRRLAAIMFTDTVGYTASTQSDEARTLELLHRQQELVRPLLAHHQGREIKSTGDGLLVEFDSALKATQCAVDIQRRIYERNAEGSATPIRIRIGIHLGDVVQSGADILGDAVNIAARIEPVAEPGGICVSGAVREQVWNKIPDRFEKLPPTALKGLQVQMDIYRVVLPWSIPTAPQASEPRARLRLAVLPLSNISPDPRDEYFADGLTEELIGALSKIPNLRVIARTSVGQYKSSSKSVSQIGTELDVGSVLEGSVRKAGNRLRIALKMVDTTTQEQVWAMNYDRELDDVFAVQTEIAEGAATALRLELAGPQRETTKKTPTPDLVAYSFYLRGIHAARLATPEGYHEAIGYFENAISKDPDFSQAYSQLADMFVTLSGDALPPREAFPRAKELVAKALRLDPDSSEAHAVLGNLALQHEHDWAAAEREFTRAIALNPSNSNAHYWHAVLLAALQRFDEALGELRITVELDPLWSGPTVLMMVIQFYSRDFASAIASAEEERNRYPERPGPHIRLGICYLRAGRKDDARREADVSDRLRGPGRRLDSAILRAGLGEPDEARALAAEWTEASRTQYVQSVKVAILFAAVGDVERALEWLDRDYQSGDRFLWDYYQWRELDLLRDEPRFKSMLERLGLPSARIDAP